MNTLQRIFTFGCAAALLVASAGVAQAATPVLTLSGGSSDIVTVTVTGDANSPVFLYYNAASASGLQVRNLGSTNSNGSFSGTVSTSAYGVTPGGSVYVVVNGSQSIPATWPYSSGAPSLSQTSVTLSVGQSLTIYSYGSSNSVYVASNGNYGIANVVANGTQITVTGVAGGSTSASLCYQGNASACATLSVTVQGSSSGTITFSQNNVTLNAGQNAYVTVSGGSGSYFVSNNSNANVAQASINGTLITLYGTSTGGTASITVCSGGANVCGILSVTVGGTNTSSVSFSQTNVFLSSGGNQSITIYGSGNYSMSNNSNPSAVAISLTGNVLTVYASATGSSNITICQQAGGCGTLSVTVNGNTTNQISFSQTSPFVASGQNVTITIYGGTGSYYIASNSNSGVAGSSISGSTLTLSGITSGTATVRVCSSYDVCGSVTVTVGAVTTTPVTFSQTSPTITVGQSVSITISGGSGSYYLPSLSNGSVQASINGNTVTLYGNSVGSGSISVCSTGGGCGSIYVVVQNSTSGSGTPLSFSQTNVTLAGGQTSTISLSGNGGYYVSGSQNTSIASVSVNGSIATIYGIGAGSMNVTICQSGGQCGVITVTVSSSGSTGGSPVSFSQTSPTVAVGQSIVVSIYGSGNYYLPLSSTGNVQANVSGNTLTLTGTNAGAASISVCTSIGGCGSVYVTVTAASSGTGSSDPLAQLQALQAQLAALQNQAGQTSGTPSSSSYKFLKPLSFGSEGKDVTELQKRLTTEGIYRGPVTGYYGSLTVAAVKKYQKAHGLDQLGNVGPGTRAALNQ